MATKDVSIGKQAKPGVLNIRKNVLQKNFLHEMHKYVNFAYHQLDESVYLKHYIQLDTIDIWEYVNSRNFNTMNANIIRIIDIIGKINDFNIVTEVSTDILSRIILAIKSDRELYKSIIDIIETYIIKKNKSKYFKSYIEDLYYPDLEKYYSTFNFINIVYSLKKIGLAYTYQRD